MKLALISDIHGNAAALDAVLRDLDAQRPDRVFVLGDLAYRGAEPKRTLALVRSLGCPVIGGNADLWVTRGIREGEVAAAALERMRREREWTLAHLDDADLAYLAALPDAHSEELPGGAPLLLCHAAPDDRFRIVRPDAPDGELLATFARGRKPAANGPAPAPAAVAAYGHIHLPFVRFAQGVAVINPGSVGLPFDGVAKASYALLEFDRAGVAVSIRRAAYDLDRATEALARLDYPEAELVARAIRTGLAP